MYILELLFKLLNKNKEEKTQTQELSFEASEYDEEKCEHIFLPIDSTKKVLACTKCGYMIKPEKQPKKNFFMK